MPHAVEASSKWFTNLTSSFPARLSMFVIVLPPVLTVLSWSSSASALILCKKVLKRVGRADNLGPFQLWFATILLCCFHGRLLWSPGCRGIPWFWSGCHWCYSASWLHTKLYAKLCGTPSWSQRRLVKALLVLQAFLTEYSKIESLLSCATSCSEACLFFFDDLLSLWLQSIQEDSTVTVHS